MRLLVVSTWCPSPPVNGSKQRAFHLLSCLSARHAIRLVTFAGPDDDAAVSGLAPALESVDAVRASPFLPGQPGLRGLLSTRPRSLVQTMSPRMAEAVVRRAAGCDAALALGVPAALYVGDTGLPWAVDEVELGQLHDRLAGPSGRLGLRARLTWWKARRFTRALAATSGFVSVVSELERAFVEGTGCDPSRVVIVPNGVPLADFEIRETPEPDSIVYPGAITYAPNRAAVVELIGHILPAIRRRRPDARLTVTGGTSPDAMAGMPTADRVVFAGVVPDVRPVVARSAVCVVPLRAGGGTRLKVLAAMAVGTPVVATSKAIEGLDVRDGEHLLVAETSEALADAALRVLENAAFARALAEQARAFVRDRYVWDDLADRLDQALHRLVAA